MLEQRRAFDEQLCELEEKLWAAVQDRHAEHTRRLQIEVSEKAAVTELLRLRSALPYLSTARVDASDSRAAAAASGQGAPSPRGGGRAGGHRAPDAAGAGETAAVWTKQYAADLQDSFDHAAAQAAAATRERDAHAAAQLGRLVHELKLVRSGLVETQGGLTDEIAGDKSRQAATAAALVAQAEAAAAEAAAAGGSTDRVRAELVVQQDLSRSLKEQVRKLPESESVGHGLVCGVCVIYRVDVQVRQLQESEDILRTQAEASQAAAAAALADAQAALKEKAAVLAEEQARARAQEKQASDLLAGTCAWKHTRALLSL